MNICSIEFILYVTVAFILYWTIFSRTRRWQNAFLLLCSMCFYAIWDWRALGLLIITVLITYVTGCINESGGGKKQRLWATTLGITINIGILGFFKYFNFFSESFVSLMKSVFHSSLSYTTLDIILPVGISFYTFSSISYIVDTYKKDVEPTRDIVVVALYMSFFPAILSGPIHKATKQFPQYLVIRSFDSTAVIRAFRMILWGAFMKLCIADRLGVVVDSVYSNITAYSGVTVFLSSVLYTLQIYADFAGYSLIAIGVALMFGIELQNNFNKPYLSKSITEFWKKWHISLTSWFRNYVYFPLGGNRVSNARWMINIMVVFLLSGLWHGAAISFIIWGGVHGIIQLVEKKIFNEKIKEIEHVGGIAGLFHILITFLIVNFAWVLFRLPFNEATIAFKTMFTSFSGELYLGRGLTNIWITLFCLLILIIKECVDSKSWANKLWNSSVVLRWGIYYIMAFCLMIFGNSSSESFIYYQF